MPIVNPKKAKKISLRSNLIFLVFHPILAVCTSCSGPNQDGIAQASKTESTLNLSKNESVIWCDPASTRHDFGLVLAGSDVSRIHKYRITNTSGHPVHVRGVANRKPCCGKVDPIAATVVEPGQSIEIVVTIHIGLAAGRVLHVAAIESEGSDEPDVVIQTLATAHSRATFDEIGPVSGPLAPGQSRRVEYLVRTFGHGSDTAPILDHGAIRSELPAEWIGLQTSRSEDDAGIVENRRTLAVTLPASNDPGPRSASLEVLDGAGFVVGRRRLNWEIAAMMKASPAGLVFTSAEQSSAGIKVVIRSRDGSLFRIVSTTTELDGLDVQFDGDVARPLQSLVARFVSSGRQGARTGELIVRTDQPGQPVVRLGVYVIGQEADAATHDAKEASR